MMVVLYKDIETNQNQFNQLRLDAVIDYATSAGFKSSLKGGDLAIEYKDLENVKLEPENVLNTYKTIILLSYNMSLSEENYDMLDNYISSSVLAADDGYYIATAKGENDMQLTWGLKKPYIVDYSLYLNNKEDGTRQKVLPIYIAYNLSSEDWVAITTSSKVVSEDTDTVNLNQEGIVIDRGDSWTRRYNNNAKLTDYTVTKPSRSHVISDINKTIMDDINYNIKYRNSIIEKAEDGSKKIAYTSGFDNDFVYLPAVETTTGINAIRKPSYFTTLSNVTFAGTDKLNAKAVGGETLSRKIRIVGFIENGKKYYAYEGQIPKEEASKVDLMFSDAEEAARRGYYPHIKYLSKPIPKK